MASVRTAEPVTVDRSAQAYRLREWLWDNSARPRGQGCGRDVIGGDVFLEYGNGQARYQGLATCGSVWSCPVCAPKIGGEKAQWVRKAIGWARGEGLHVVFLTSTVRHGGRDRLIDLRKQLSGAWRRLRQSRAWRQGVGASIVHSIKSTEVTYGTNGWHPHAHSILFVRASTAAAARRLVIGAAPLWVDAVIAEGGFTQGGPGWDVKVIEPDDDQIVSDYIAKWGAPPSEPTRERLHTEAADQLATRASFELALRTTKRAGKGLSWLQLLELAAAGSWFAAALFNEYESAMAGVQALVPSDGLWEAADVHNTTDDQVAEQPEPMTVEGVATITKTTWRTLVRNRETLTLLQTAREGPAAIAHFFLARYPTMYDAGVCIEHGDPFA